MSDNPIINATTVLAYLAIGCVIINFVVGSIEEPTDIATEQSPESNITNNTIPNQQIPDNIIHERNLTERKVAWAAKAARMKIERLT